VKTIVVEAFLTKENVVAFQLFIRLFYKAFPET